MDKEVDEIKIIKSYRNSKNAIETVSEVQRKIEQNNHTAINVEILSESMSVALFPIIWSLPYFGMHYGKKITMRYIENSNMHQKIEQYGITKHYHKSKTFSVASQVENTNCISAFYQSHSLDELQPAVDKIIESLPIKLSNDLEDILYSKINEVFSNAHTHGYNKYGSFSMGYYNKSSKQLVISLYDLGIGIPTNVNNYLKHQKGKEFKSLSTKQTFEWAFQNGNSTLVTDFPRGAGFGVLEKFVKLNNGQMYICSGNGYYKINKDGRKFSYLKNHLKGTFFNMIINPDKDHIYIIGEGRRK